MNTTNHLSASVESWSKSPIFSYVTILLLQLKAVWGFWSVHDVSGGDTSSYFVGAVNWFKHGTDVITWSPLYTAYYGSFLHFSENAVFVTFAHRMVIVFVLAGLVLGLMRRIFPPGLAWLLTAWWVILPTNFGAMYEVHMFAFIPILVALILIDGASSWRTGAALATLLAATLLCRNETMFALVPLAVMVAIAEARRQIGKERGLSLSLAYGLPLLLCFLLTGYFYLQAVDAKAIDQMLRSKANVCQSFSFGYQQRHPDQNGWVWSECDHRMQQIFGRPEATFPEAFSANPRAVIEHFTWNVRLLPAGLQLLLFGVTSGKETPDYDEPIRSALVLPISVFTLLLFIVACYLGLRHREDWRPWFRERKWVLLGLASFLPMSAVIILTQRPRPEYLFSLEATLQVAIGWAVLVFVSRLPRWRMAPGLFAVFCLAMISVWPTYASWAAGETTLSRTYARLEPARRLFERADTRLVTSAYGFDLCNYLSRGTASCTPVEMKTLEERMAGGSSFERALEREGATLFYADADTMGIPAIKRFVANPLSGWRVAAYQSVGLEKWALVEKSTSTALPEPDGPVDIVPSTGPVALGPGWYGFERYGEVTMRWVHNDAVIVFTDLPRASLSIDVEVGPGSSAPGPLKLSALVDDDAIGQIFELTGRKILTVDNLPVHGEHQLRLHADGEGKPLPTDARILRFRVFRIFVPTR